MLTPLPRVTKPLMPSGGAGLQHLASCVISESTPTTSTPPLGDRACVGRDLRASSTSSSVGCSAGGCSSTSMLRRENSSLPTTKNMSSAT
jgi:hypothetical protein